METTSTRSTLSKVDLVLGMTRPVDLTMVSLMHNRTVPPAANATAGIFCTYPAAYLTKASQFFSEFIASTILMFVIFAMKDDSNPGAMGKSGAGMLFPIVLLFLIYGIGVAFGSETGYAINLARDFGPRLMSYILGYGSEVWSAGGYYFWSK